MSVAPSPVGRSDRDTGPTVHPVADSDIAPITAISTRVVSARYRRPFTISSGISTDLISLVVEIETADGTIGVGETSPMTAYTGETLAGVTSAIEEHLAPALIGRNPLDRAGAHLVMDAVLRGQHVAKAGLDIALYDLAGRLCGWPVHALLGGAIRDRVQTAWVVGLGTLDEMAAEAAEYADRGFRHLKVKGGTDPAQDLELVRAVRAALPADAELCLDANEGYDATTALPMLAKMTEAGLSLLEQPLPRWDLAGLVRLRERLDVRIMVDESMHSLTGRPGDRPAGSGRRTQHQDPQGRRTPPGPADREPGRGGRAGGQDRIHARARCRYARSCPSGRRSTGCDGPGGLGRADAGGRGTARSQRLRRRERLGRRTDQAGPRPRRLTGVSHARVGRPAPRHSAAGCSHSDGLCGRGGV